MKKSLTNLSEKKSKTAIQCNKPQKTKTTVQMIIYTALQLK